MENYSVKEGKTIAIISYLWFVGMIIAIVMNATKKNAFASFHIRQMIGLMLSHIAAGLVGTYISGSIGWALGVVIFIFWIIGLLGALQEEEKKVPLFGDQFQDWFQGIG